MRYANISWVTDTLATGGDLSFDPNIAYKQVEEIIDSGVELIIDCRTEGEVGNDGLMWQDKGIGYLNLPTDDSIGHHIPQELFDKAVIEARHYIDADEKVLVHCHMGVNRGPSVAYAILLDLDYDAVKAFDLIRDKRPQAAVYYAMDALEAELARGRDFHMDVDKDRLALRMKEAFTPEERRRIQHIIRAHHDRDRAEIVGQTEAWTD